MNKRGPAFILFHTLMLAGFGFATLGSGTGTATAQTQAAPKAQKQLPGKMPVTPFGPRVRRAPGAQGGAPAGPKPEILLQEGMWRVICETVPVAKDKTQKACYVSATATDPKRKGVFVSLIVLKVKRKDAKGKPVMGHMMNVRAPVGVYLPTGIALEIDGKAIARVPFIRCNPMFCESLAEARPETLAKLKKGKKAKFIVYGAPGQGLPLEFDLKGFTAALKKLDGMKN